MDKYSQTQLNSLFHALSDQTRRDIVERLSEEQLTGNQLAGHYKISQAAVSKHLRVLEKADLVKNTKIGRKHIFTVNTKQMDHVRLWMEKWSKYWNKQLDNWENFLQTNHNLNDK